MYLFFLFFSLRLSSPPLSGVCHSSSTTIAAASALERCNRYIHKKRKTSSTAQQETAGRKAMRGVSSRLFLTYIVRCLEA